MDDSQVTKKVLKTRRPANEENQGSSPSNSNMMDIDPSLESDQPSSDSIASHPSHDNTPAATEGTPIQPPHNLTPTTTHTSESPPSANNAMDTTPSPAVIPNAEDLRLARLKRFGGAANPPSSSQGNTSAQTPTSNTPPCNTPSNTSSGGSTKSDPVPAKQNPNRTLSTSSDMMDIDSTNNSGHSPSINRLNKGSSLTPTISSSPSAPASHIASKLENSLLSTSPNNSSHSPLDPTSILHNIICQVLNVTTSESSSSKVDFQNSSSSSLPKSFIYSDPYKSSSLVSSSSSSMSISSPYRSSPSSSNPSEEHIFYVSAFQELKQSGSSAPSNMITLDDLDLIFGEILGTKPSKIPSKWNLVGYFCGCLKRLESRKSNKQYASLSSQFTTLSNRIISYFALAIEHPLIWTILEDEMKANPMHMVDSLVKYLGKNSINKEYLSLITNTIYENGGNDELKSVFDPIITHAAAFSRMNSAQVKFDPVYHRPIHALEILASNKLIAPLFVSHSKWKGSKDVTGFALDSSLLGCVLTYSPLYAFLRQDIEGSMFSLPYESMHNVIFELIRSQKEPTLNWIANALLKNKDNLKFAQQGRQVSSMAFCNSLATVMLRMCKPFMERTSERSRQHYASFDPNYLLRPDSRLEIMWDSSETRIVADKTSFEQYKQTIVNQDKIKHTPTFITECFYLTLLANIEQITVFTLYEGVFGRHAEMTRIQHMDEVTKLELDKIVKAKSIIEDVLFTPEHFQQAFFFWEMVGVWLVRVACTADNENIPAGLNFVPRLPLNPTPPMHYQCLPELFLDHYGTFMSFASKYWSKFSDQAFGDVLSTLVTLLSSPSYVKNPHIRIKLVQVISTLMPISAGGRLLPTARSPFDAEYIALNLGPALTQLYVDVERTGSASQFYDRLNARHDLSGILVYLWKQGLGHKNAISDHWDSNHKAFISFLSMQLNDLIYLLDEALSKMGDVKSSATKIASLENRADLTKAERDTLRDNRELFERSVRQSITYNTLLKETMNIFSMVCVDYPCGIFFDEQQKKRVASLVSYYIYELNPQKQEIKTITNRELLRFEPEKILHDVVKVMLSASSHDQSFPTHVAEDNRYNKQAFDNVIESLARISKISTSQLSAWKAAMETAESQTGSAQDFSELLGEIPDDLIDPITAELMRDPVRLPSGTVMDRSCITRILLSDKMDPFTRAPLTEDQLVSDEETKSKVEAYVLQKTGKPLSSWKL